MDKLLSHCPRCKSDLGTSVSNCSICGWNSHSNSNRVLDPRLIEAVRKIERRQRTWEPEKDEESIFSEDYLKGKSSGLLDALFELEQHIPELKERKE